MKLRFKILLMLIPLIVLLSFTLGWLAYGLFKSNLKQTMFKQLDTLLNQVVLHVESDLQTVRANLALFSSSEILQKYTLADEEDRYAIWQRPILTLFSSYTNAYRDYYEFRVILPDGFEDTRFTLDKIPNATEEEDGNVHFHEMKKSQKDIFIKMVLNPDDNQMALWASKKLIFKDWDTSAISEKKLRGYLVITIRPRYMEDQVVNSRIGESGWIFITNNEGQVLFHPDRKRLQTSLPKELMNRLKQYLKTGDVFREVLEGQNVYIQGVPLQSNLYLFGVLPETEILSATRKLGNIIALITLVSIVFTGGLLYVFLNFLLIKPIQRLDEASQEITEGRLDLPLTVNKSLINRWLYVVTLGGIDRRNKVSKLDEIGSLTKSFDHMRNSVRNKINDLRLLNQKIELQNEKLIIAEEKYRSIFENITVGIFQVSTEGQVLTCNPSFLIILGYQSLNDLMNHISNINNVKFFSDQSKQNDLYNQLEESGHVNDFEIECYRKDGSVITALLNVHTVLDENHKARYFEGILENITQKKQAQEFKVAKEVAEASNNAKSEFLANMSHEIRTPMNAILGFAELLKGRIKEPHLQQHLQSIHSSGKSLMGLINDILDLSKVEAGKLELQYTAVSPKQLFDEIGVVFLQKIEEKKLKLVIEVPPDLPGALILDEIRLRQILINLVGNAVKFTESGHIKLSANFHYSGDIHRSSLDFVFSVEDTGKGIPKDQLLTIFSAFSQVKGQKQAQYGGTGLGLAITRRLIDLMDGEITVESELEKGTIFKILIKGVEIASAEVVKNQADLQIDPETINFDKSTILITDDIDYNRDLLKGFLESYDFEFLEAENGEQALETIRQQNPQLVLMDIKMPVMDGYEASMIIKNDEQLKHIPVIAVSASAMKEEEEEIEKLCDSFLRKPVGRIELISEIMKYLHHTITGDDPTAPDKGIPSTNHELSAEQKAAITLLLPILENELMEEWSAMKSTIDFSRIGTFASRVLELSEKNDLTLLKTWGGNLQQQVKNFDMERLPETLKSFPGLIEEIKSHCNSA